MTPLIEQLAEAKREGNYQAFMDAIPYARFLGLSGAMVGDELITTMHYADHLIGNPALPALHGGTLGALLTGILATKAVNSNLKDELLSALLGSQIKAILLTLVLSVVMTAVIAYIVKAIIGLRPTPDVETGGLDINEHGEEGYSDGEGAMLVLTSE